MFDTVNVFLLNKKRVRLIEIKRLGLEKEFGVLKSARIEGVLLISVLIEGVDIFFIYEWSILFRWDVTFVDKEIWNLGVLVLERLNFFQLPFDFSHLRSFERQQHRVLSADGFASTSALDSEVLGFFYGPVVEASTANQMITWEDCELDGFLMAGETNKVVFHI